MANKFYYTKTKKLPKLKKIILNFGCKNNDIKSLTSSLLALELITHQKGNLTTTKYSNVLLKIRKGNTVGCKITLRKNKMFYYFEKMLIEIFPKLKNFEGFKSNKKMQKKAFSYELYDTFSFSELEENYHLFNNLPKLDITIVISNKTKLELLFLLTSLQFPIKTQI